MLLVFQILLGPNTGMSGGMPSMMPPAPGKMWRKQGSHTSPRAASSRPEGQLQGDTDQKGRESRNRSKEQRLHAQNMTTSAFQHPYLAGWMVLNKREAGPDCHVLSVAVKYVPLCPPPLSQGSVYSSILRRLISWNNVSVFILYIYIYNYWNSVPKGPGGNGG